RRRRCVSRGASRSALNQPIAGQNASSLCAAPPGGHGSTIQHPGAGLRANVDGPEASTPWWRRPRADWLDASGGPVVPERLLRHPAMNLRKRIHIVALLLAVGLILVAEILKKAAHQREATICSMVAWALLLGAFLYWAWLGRGWRAALGELARVTL